MTRLRCQLGWLPTVKWAGLFVAVHEGLFERRGIEVEIAPGGPRLRGAGRAVESGVADIGLASDVVDIVRIIDGGFALRMLGAVSRRTPLGIATLGDRPPVMADLVGATLGAGTGDDRHVLDALFAANGVPADYRFVLTGRGLDELASGAVAAMNCSTLSQVPAARRRGLRVASATFGELGLPLVGDVVVTSANVIDQHRDAVVAFMAALAEGWAIDAAQPERGAEATMARRWPDDVQFDRADVDTENALNLAFMKREARPGASMLALDAADLEPTIAALRGSGAIGAQLTAAACLDELVAADALAAMVR